MAQGAVQGHAIGQRLSDPPPPRIFLPTVGERRVTASALRHKTRPRRKDAWVLRNQLRYWDGAYSAQEWVCLGCTPADQGFLAKYCATCKIRGCAIEKKVQNCAACDGYESCQMLKDFIKGENEALCKRMEWLRGRFLALQTERPAAAG
ncbi:MAG: DUF3795 domain-containing protein [Candidatus Bipolaricaulota bacterium]|nr:DUF3795 domain-containing protein [Candidatus Bipolaricaulota bacterium]